MPPRPNPAIRPATISELAAVAQSDPDASPSSNLDLKHYLRRAESHRKTGTALASGAGGGPTASNRSGSNDTGTDLERAFIEYAQAATLIVEKIPAHREFATGLTAEQKSNLTANGEDILHQIGRLKALLVDRYERYARSAAASAEAVPFFKHPNFTAPLDTTQPRRRASQQVHTQAQRVVADEAALWRAQREEAAARDAAASSYRYTSPGPSSSASYAGSTTTYPSTVSTPATGYGSPAPSPTAAPSGVSMPMPAPVSLAGSGVHPSAPQPTVLPPTFTRGSSSSAYAYPTNPSGTGPGPGPAYPSSAGVSFATSYPNPHAGAPALSQYGASASQHGAGSSSASQYASSIAGQYAGGSSASQHSGSPSSYAPSTNSSSSAYPYPASEHTTPTPGPMPLRPAHAPEYEYDGESTDSEGGGGRGGWRAGKGGSLYPSFPRPSPSTGPDDLTARMAGLSTSGGRIEGLPPTSHTSPVAYPALARHMSSHQRTQGYVPGAWGSSLPPAAPSFAAFAPDSTGAGAGAAVGFAGVGARAALDAARAAASSSGAAAAYPTSFAPPEDPRVREREQREREREEALAATRAAAARTEAERAERESAGPYPRLRTVVLPHATLPRFLAIASANSARNLETCGLLLGREVMKAAGSSSKMRYVVETLLIPKQHATSDTCTMDEEEGVLGFTEERGLITLGWIHTHPSQSCFMSSVDLHTHASFQRMLPESFAVVCAPKSDPNFGIFRLTDPPGLQTVLQCTAKQAFHPHPDVPIYTDADRGHVQMRDAPLEIVDLR